MKSLLGLFAVLLLPQPVFAQTAPAGESSRIRSIAESVTPDRIESSIRSLVGFGTRHTLSDTLSDTRGIGAARRWVHAQFEQISNECGGCLEVFFLGETFPSGGRRLRDDQETRIVNVVAIQRGETDPNRMVIMAGDIDAIRSRGQGSGDSDSVPGANDNASGMAGTIEAARILSRHRFNGSIVYLGLSGEEQGLYGGGTVARHARSEGWNIVAVLNNDMIGNIEGINGVIDNTTARVFSEPTPMNDRIRAQIEATAGDIREFIAAGDRAAADSAIGVMQNLTEAQWQLFRRQGGEVDGTSRQIARYVDRMADIYLPTLDVMMVYRLDRFGRGGHHTPFNNEGFPGVRIMETNENYNRQHQDIRVEDGISYGDVLEGVDFDYAAKLTALNAVTLASLAAAPGSPQGVQITGAVRPAATLMWDAPSDSENVAGYRVYWRLTDSPTWDFSQWVGLPTEWEGREAQAEQAARFNRTLPEYGFRFDGLVIDNYFFGVAAVAADGAESLVVFPLPQ